MYQQITTLEQKAIEILDFFYDGDGSEHAMLIASTTQAAYLLAYQKETVLIVNELFGDNADFSDFVIDSIGYSVCAKIVDNDLLSLKPFELKPHYSDSIIKHINDLHAVITSILGEV